MLLLFANIQFRFADFKFPFWKARPDFVPERTLKQNAGHEDQYQTNFASPWHQDCRCDQCTFLAYCFPSEALAMNLCQTFWRSNLADVAVVSGSPRKGFPVKRQGGIIWDVRSIVGSYLPRELWATDHTAGSLRQGNVLQEEESSLP
jgi:hypothetical protein